MEGRDVIDDEDTEAIDAAVDAAIVAAKQAQAGVSQYDDEVKQVLVESGRAEEWDDLVLARIHVATAMAEFEEALRAYRQGQRDL